MPWSPSVTVAAVIRRQDRYLMVEEQPDGLSVINQPAGHLESGESLADAVRREVLEETGRIFSPTGLIGVYQWAVPGADKSYLRFCFSGSVGEPLPEATTDPDIHATHWLTRAEIAAGGLPVRSQLVLRCIDDANGATPLSLDLLRRLT